MLVLRGCAIVEDALGVLVLGSVGVFSGIRGCGGVTTTTTLDYSWG